MLHSNVLIPLYLYFDLHDYCTTIFFFKILNSEVSNIYKPLPLDFLVGMSTLRVQTFAGTNFRGTNFCGTYFRVVCREIYKLLLDREN